MRLALSIMIYHFLSGTFPLENYQTLAKKREERLRKIVWAIVWAVIPISYDRYPSIKGEK